jgi:hypothetical protein
MVETVTARSSQIDYLCVVVICRKKYWSTFTARVCNPLVPDLAELPRQGRSQQIRWPERCIMARLSF